MIWSQIVCSMVREGKVGKLVTVHFDRVQPRYLELVKLVKLVEEDGVCVHSCRLGAAH